MGTGEYPFDFKLIIRFCKVAYSGSYVCFTTISLPTVDMYLLLRLCTTCRYQTTATGWERVLRLD